MMATEVPNDGTLFIFDHGFIPLSTLESWYTQGYITPNDTIRIFAKNQKSYAIKISALIQMYGSEFPFRKIPINSESKNAEDVTKPGPSESGQPAIVTQDSTVIPKKVGGAFGASKQPTAPIVKEVEKVEKKEEFIYMDYPLYNVDNEPEEDKITGQEVLDEMEKLKLQFNYKHFTDRYSTFFWFINRRKNEDREEIAICRLCNYTPYRARIFFLHLFNNYHIQELSKNQVSRKSFNYWSRQFEALKMEEKMDLDKKQALEMKEKEEKNEAKKVKKLEIQKPIQKSEVLTTSSENSEVKVEYSRIPLLNPPLVDNVRCSQKEFVNFCKSLSKAMENLAAKAIAKHKIVHWKCGYCSFKSGPAVIMSTELDAFNHLMTQKHKEKMKFTAPPDDLLFWGNWAIDINRQIEQLQNPEIQKISEDVKKIQISSSKPTTSVQKPTTSSESAPKVPTIDSTLTNTPRVPMLDPMPPSVNLVTKQKFNEILDQCAEMFQKDRKRLSAAKFEPRKWNCAFCGTKAKKMNLSNVQDSFLHITKGAHREKMQYKATLPDLMYWKNWAESYGISPKVLEQKKLAETQKTATTENVVKKEVKNRKTGGTEKNEPFKKGFNKPRIPLLDVPKDQQKLMKQSHFKSTYQSLCDLLKTRKSYPETEKSVQCMCYHCPGDTRITTVYGILQHVFNGQHCKYIQFSATPSDFNHYQNLINRMPLNPESVAVKKTPVSVVNPLPQVAVHVPESSTLSKLPVVVNERAVPEPVPRVAPEVAVSPSVRTVPAASTHPLPKLPVVTDKRIVPQGLVTPAPVPVPPATRSIVVNPSLRTVTAVRTVPATSTPYRVPCILPLFSRRDPDSPFTTHWGPTNAIISIVNRPWRMRSQSTPYFENGTYCSLCQKDMSFWTLLEVVQHAFTVDHLRMYGRPENIDHRGVTYEKNRYLFWIEKLRSACYLESTIFTDISIVSHLGISSHGPRHFSDVFADFTSSQKATIANVDIAKLNTCFPLLQKFGGCIYCNKWLLTGEEVYKHWVNHSHMTKIRQQHAVGQCAMDELITSLESCQKEKSSCIVM